MKQGRNLWLDLFKLILCWMIISIHFVWETYDYHPVYRLAVPLFFAISGYFNYRKDTDALLWNAKIFISRSLKYMLIGFGFYILFDFVMCYVDGNGVGYYFTTLFYEDFLFEFVFLNRPITYSGAQLWYLIALVIVSVIHYCLVRFQKQRWYLWIVPAGLAIQLFFGAYMRVFQYTDMPIRYTRNAWFNGLPFFGLGYLLAQHELHKKSWYKWIYLALGIGFTLLQIPEQKNRPGRGICLHRACRSLYAAVLYRVKVPQGRFLLPLVWQEYVVLYLHIAYGGGYHRRQAL